MPGTSTPFRPARWSAGELGCQEPLLLGDVPRLQLRLASLTDFVPACPLPGLPLQQHARAPQQHAESATACPIRRGLNALISSAYQL